MGFFDSVTKGVSRGLGDIFTAGLAETNLGNGFFKKVGRGVGDTLTLQPMNKGGGGAPNLPPPAKGTAYDSSGDLSKLEALFAPIRDSSYKAIDAGTADQLRKLRSDQAARGVLRSGVSDYPSTELTKANSAAKGSVEAQLASLLGGTESNRSLINTQAALQSAKDAADYNRNLDLIKSITDANKPSQLSQIFQGVSAFAPLLGAAFGPGGMLAGSVLANGAGANGASRLASMFGPTSSANSALPIGMI